MRLRRIILPFTVIAIGGLVATGCSSADADAEPASDSSFRIVTSTSVYADIVSAIVGDGAEVEAVIDSAAVDPHDYEATARDGLTVKDADLVIMNGGGYDQFMTDLLETAGVEHVMSVVEFSHAYPGDDGEHDEDDHEHADESEHADEGEHADEDEHAHEYEDEHAEAGDDHDHVHGFNEHVWYDPHTIEHFAEALQEELDELIPEAADQVAAGTRGVLDEIAALEGRLDVIASDHEGEAAFFTEPVGGYFAEAAGLEDATTDGFAEAVEHGEDVAPAVLNKAIKSIESGEVSVLVANAQTGGAETSRVIEVAESNDVPVIEFTETIPDGESYFGWMNANADALEGALG
ncbi:MAG: metal ABC transporter solute-binding protein, Zn/Mn family [Microbacterium gubbeenense]